MAAFASTVMTSPMRSADSVKSRSSSPFHVGMIGLAQNDLPSSVQDLLLSQTFQLCISWLPSDVCDALHDEPTDSYDLIFLDCRKGLGTTTPPDQLRSLAGEALIMGFFDLHSVEIADQVDVDIAITEQTAARAVRWAIREGTRRKHLISERDELRQKVEEASYDTEMADVASTVLHNIGNVLNSVNVAAKLVHELVHQSSMVFIQRIAELLKERQQDWETFLTQDPKGKRIPPALMKMGEPVKKEQQVILKEIEGLVRNVDHVKQIIVSHQTMTKSGGMGESLSVIDLINQALELSLQPGDRSWIRIQREFQSVPDVLLDRHQMLQVLVNLLRNAKQAMHVQGGSNHCLTITTERRVEPECAVLLSIQDTGIGIAPEHLPRMFSRGFTTKRDGNGIGLHSAMTSIHRMGGSLEVCSQGLGTGATFTLILPIAKTHE